MGSVLTWHYNSRRVQGDTTQPSARLLLGHGLDDVTVTGVGDGEHGHAEVFTAGSSQDGVVAIVVVYLGLGKHGVVLDFGFAKGRGVGSNNNQLSLARAQSLHGGLVSKAEFSALNHQLEAGVHVFGSSFLRHVEFLKSVPPADTFSGNMKYLSGGRGGCGVKG